MAKIPQHPQQRGLTASTDMRIVRRPYKSVASISAVRTETLVKYVSPPPPPPAPAPASPAHGGIIWSSGGGGSGAGGTAIASAPPAPASAPQLPTTSMYARIIGAMVRADDMLITPVEYVLQQAWYSPYGEKEWHDLDFVDQVPEENLP